MTNAELLSQLHDLTYRLGIEVRVKSGEFTGGICTVRGRRILFVNSSLPSEQRIDVICRELSRQDLSGVFIIPALRKKLEKGAFPDLDSAVSE